ncbi:MAG: YlxR family protein [Polyangiaceae bacterium]
MKSTENAHGARRTPVRTCVGCGEESPQTELVRFVFDTDAVVPDLRGSSFGRGVYVHAAPKCFDLACRFGFAKAFSKAPHTEGSLSVDKGRLEGELSSAIDARLEGLLRAAHRTGELAWGTEFAFEAASTHPGSILLLALDCGGSVLSEHRLDSLVAEGRVCPWKTKAELGSLFGQPEVSLCAIRSKSISFAFQSTYSLRSSFVSFVATEGQACKSPEVL